MYNPLLVKQASPVSDSRMAGTSSIWGWPQADKNPFKFIDQPWPSSAPIGVPRYPWAGGNPAPAGQQPAQQPQQQSNDPEWSGMYGKDVWRDYQMHKKYMNDPEYKAFTEWYNQNKGRYGTPQQPQQQPAQQPQQPAGGIQPGPGWPTGPLGTDGWRLPFRNRPNPHYNPLGTGPQQPYITPEGEPASSPFGSPFNKGRVMGGVFGESGPGMSWEDTRRALMM